MLTLTKKAREKDAVKIFDLKSLKQDCRAHFQAPIGETMTGHISGQNRPFGTNQLHSIRSLQ